MPKKSFFLISSGIPDKTNKYRSPYILRYIELLKNEFNVVLISPKFYGVFGILECNLKIIYLYFKGEINSFSKIYIHSILHGLIFSFFKGHIFVNFHGVEIFSFSNKFVRYPIQFFLKRKGNLCSGIFPSHFMMNSVLEKYKLQFKNVLINYSLGVNLSKSNNLIQKDSEYKIFYPGNCSSLKGIEEFEYFVVKFPSLKFFCLPSVYIEFKKFPNVYLQEEYEFDNRYEVLSNYSVLLQMSNFESLSLIVMESYIMGLKCIVKEIPVMKELKIFLPDLFFYSSDLDLNLFKTNHNSNRFGKNIELISDSECIFKTNIFLNA
jgi:hypothetical protein